MTLRPRLVRHNHTRNIAPVFYSCVDLRSITLILQIIQVTLSQLKVRKTNLYTHNIEGQVYYVCLCFCLWLF